MLPGEAAEEDRDLVTLGRGERPFGGPLEMLHVRTEAGAHFEALPLLGHAARDLFLHLAP